MTEPALSALSVPNARDAVRVALADYVSALMLAAQLVVGAGDRVVAVTPLWPNLVEIPKILGAHVETVALQYGDNGWALDVEQMLMALTPDTRMLLINSPNNPTGWVMSRDDQRTVLESGGMASGSSPTKYTNVCTTQAARPTTRARRRRFSIWPRATSG